MAAESIWPGMFQAKAGRGKTASARISRVQRDRCGNYIHEIAEIDISYAPDGAGDR
jgi:hypothetical protein